MPPPPPPPNPAPEYFDYLTVAKAAGIPPADLAAIESLTRADYPGDQMMFELRMLRTCKAIAAGHATIADALKPETQTTNLPPASAA